MSQREPCPCCNTDWCDKDCPGWVEARRYFADAEAFRHRLNRIARMLEAEGREDRNDPLWCAAAGLPESPSPKAVERHPAVAAARQALDDAHPDIGEVYRNLLQASLDHERTVAWGIERRRRLRRGWSACPPVALERSEEPGAICLVGGE